MGINYYQLDKDKDYTLCIEVLNSDYHLWHKSVATIEKKHIKGGISCWFYGTKVLSPVHCIYIFYQNNCKLSKNCIRYILQSGSLC